MTPMNGSGSRGRSVGRKGESEVRAPTVDIATPTRPSVRKNPRQGRARVPGDANSAIARFAIVASPRTARRSSRCSRSPTYSLPAGHSRPHDERRGESLPAEGRNTAGTSINDENPAPPSTHCEKSGAQRFLKFAVWGSSVIVLSEAIKLGGSVVSG